MELERQYNKTNSTFLQLAALMHHRPIPKQNWEYAPSVRQQAKRKCILHIRTQAHPTAIFLHLYVHTHTHTHVSGSVVDQWFLLFTAWYWQHKTCENFTEIHYIVEGTVIFQYSLHLSPLSSSTFQQEYAFLPSESYSPPSAATWECCFAVPLRLGNGVLTGCLYNE